MPNNSNSGQVNFTGGMRLDRRPSQSEYGYCENMILRNGFPETRPGIQRLSRAGQEFLSTGFYFGDKTDSTGFWFPFSFSNTPSIGEITGHGYFRFDGMEDREAIITTNDDVITDLSGKNIVVPTPLSETLSDYRTSFVDGNNEVLMLRGVDKSILVWTKENIEEGFVELTGEQIPKASTGVFAFNRTWLASGSDLHASSILDSSYYNSIGQSFSISPGDGEDISAVVEFKNEFLLVFKQTKVFVLSGVNTPIEAGKELADYVTIDRISKNIGCINQNSVVVKGEQVYFLSKTGISSLVRTQEGNLYGADFLVSDPISPMIDTINFENENNMCAIYFNNYLLFCVPTDNEVNPNTILVFDMKMGEQGSWVSIWKSAVNLPLIFFKVKGGTKLVGVCSDGVVRSFFNDDPWDSEDLANDMVAYNPEKLYQQEDFCRNQDTDGIYEALRETIGDDPSISPDDWEYVAVQESVYDIRSEISTYVYGDESEQVPKKHNRMELLYVQQNSNLSLFTFNHGMSSESLVFSDIKPNYLGYKIYGPSFINTNINLDFNDEHRKDYTLFIPPDGFYVPVHGVDINAWTSESIRFTYLGVNDYGVGIKIINDSGKIRLHGIIFIFTAKRFASKRR